MPDLVNVKQGTLQAIKDSEFLDDNTLYFSNDIPTIWKGNNHLTSRVIDASVVESAPPQLSLRKINDNGEISSFSVLYLPQVTSSDNGKTLIVANGKWSLIQLNAIYSGTGEPDNSLGNNGDIYLQTS